MGNFVKAAVLALQKFPIVNASVDGSDIIYHGYISFDELPMAYNPPSGIIATANQNPFPADYPYPVNGNFAPPDRSLRIRELLSARTGWHAADMLGVQTDIYSA